MYAYRRLVQKKHDQTKQQLLHLLYLIFLFKVNSLLRNPFRNNLTSVDKEIFGQNFLFPLFDIPNNF